MPDAGIKDLLEAGVHFGHQTRRWNPGMRRYIHGERDGIHIIDLLQTERLLKKAQDFAAETARGGGTILFVGTKKQARDSVREWAERCSMPYVNQRWLGGLLTNFATISKRITRLHELTRLRDDGRLELLPTKERMTMARELQKLEYNLGGVRDMDKLPQAIVVVDLKAETIGVAEARRLRIPIIGLVDSNCDPGGIDYVVPGNDDAIRSCDLVIRTIGEAIEESAGAYRAEEEAKRKKEAEERAKREAEEQARREAEEAAAAEAEAKAKEEAEKAAAAEAEKVVQAPAKPQPAARVPQPASAAAAPKAPSAPAPAEDAPKPEEPPADGDAAEPAKEEGS